MSAQPIEFTTPERVVEETPFVLDDEALVAIKPKGGQLLALAKDIRALSDSDPLAQVEIIDRFMALAMTPTTAARLTERLEDEHDAFDIDTLTEIINALQRVWTARPTGPSPASSRSRRSTGKASTGRVRSTA